MKGHIRPRGKDGKTWAIIVDVGTDSQGKRKQEWTTFHGGRKEADNKMHEIINELNKGTAIERNRLTVGEFLKRWLEDTAALEVAPRTFERYQGIIRGHLIPELGGHRLSELSSLHIQRYYRKALQGGRRDGKEGGLSPRTVVQHHRILKEALESALKAKPRPLLVANPAAGVKPPKFERKEMAILTAEQTAVLIEAAEDSRLHLPILLAATTGARLGEILALRWKDIDLTGGTVHITRSMYATKDGPQFKEPKTAKGRRLVILPAMAVEALRHHRVQQNEWRLKFGPDYSDLDLVCSLEDGRPIHNNVSRDFHALLDRAGLPKVRYHDLRHSHATLLMSEGVNPKVVSERLGHATIAITLGFYGHVTPTQQERAAAITDDLLRRRTGN